MFLESKDEVDELASFLKTNDADGVETIHIFFPHDLVRLLKYQITSLLMFRDFSMVSALFKRRALRLNRHLSASVCLIILNSV
jgi:hypothetical protein